MPDPLTSSTGSTPSPVLERPPRWLSAILLLVWMGAAVGVFLPFAVGTSPLDAVLLRVPGEQGNWWHVLVGAPFLLAFPTIWLRLRALFSTQLSTPPGRRLLWIAVALSVLGTFLVETPFLLHRAGTSELQRLSVIALGFGLVLTSGAILLARRHDISSDRACLIGLNAAYLANAWLCLIVYGEMSFRSQSRSGWYLTIVIVWPMAIELVWLLRSRTHGAAVA